MDRSYNHNEGGHNKEQRDMWTIYTQKGIRAEWTHLGDHSWIEYDWQDKGIKTKHHTLTHTYAHWDSYPPPPHTHTFFYLWVHSWAKENSNHMTDTYHLYTDCCFPRIEIIKKFNLRWIISYKFIHTAGAMSLWLKCYKVWTEKYSIFYSLWWRLL